MVSIPGRKGRVPRRCFQRMLLISYCISSESRENLNSLEAHQWNQTPVYLCKSREEGINFTHTLMQKDSSIQDFRDWKKMRKIFKRSPEILTQLSSTFSYTIKLFLRHTKKAWVCDQWPSERSSLWCQKQSTCWSCRDWSVGLSSPQKPQQDT